jgi:NAD(P)-dependent dehydrogenase (short-subunit alcohol dehydrogenase family)
MSTIVITGANRGVGLALSREYRQRGDHVIAGCRTPSAATDLAATGAEVVGLDVGDAVSIESFAAVVGDRPVDVLINNAGIDARAVGAKEALRGALDLTVDEFQAVMNVNVVGPLLMVQGLAANLRVAGGKVINISSQVGSIAVADKIGKDAAYTTSKAALNMLTVKQSQVLSPDGVTVIAMHPGWVRSEMGGPTADLDPADSASSIIAVIDGVGLHQTGSFLRWDGAVHPW